ncbi:hypothetical protein SDJN02_19133, partial [Cucurbita argyrosperma subsp. argyrosperma]
MEKANIALSRSIFSYELFAIFLCTKKKKETGHGIYRGSGGFSSAMGLWLLASTGPPIKRRAGLRIKQAGRSSYSGS